MKIHARDETSMESPGSIETLELLELELERPLVVVWVLVFIVGFGLDEDDVLVKLDVGNVTVLGLLEDCLVL